MLLICSLFTQRSNPNARSISVGRLRGVHVCLWPPASERTRQRKKQKRKKRVRGDDSLILTDCHGKIPVRTTFFSDFCLFCLDFKSCFLPYDEDIHTVPVQKYQSDISLTLLSSFSPFPPAVNCSVVSTGPPGEAGRVVPLLFVLLPFLLQFLFFWRAQQWGWGRVCGFSWPPVSQAR